MTNFDLILGMDCLSKYRVSIDYGMKKIKFAPIGAEPVTVASAGIYLPLRMISCMKACKLLQKGCQGYLASVLTIYPYVCELRDTGIACEFPDVFPDDITGLLPDREIEFVIDIVAGTHPILKSPYRLSPTEMKKLKEQLQELLDKDFIRLSFSSWGALVLFVKNKDGIPFVYVVARIPNWVINGLMVIKKV